MVKSGYNDTSKSKSLNVLETVLSHLKLDIIPIFRDIRIARHGTIWHKHVLIHSDSFSSLAVFQIYALKSFSVACVAMSAATMYHYQWGIGIILSQKTIRQFNIVEKDTEFEFTDQEKTMLAISSLAILFSIIEMILAFAFTKSCGDTGYDPPQENQVHVVTDRAKG